VLQAAGPRYKKARSPNLVQRQGRQQFVVFTQLGDYSDIANGLYISSVVLDGLLV